MRNFNGHLLGYCTARSIATVSEFHRWAAPRDGKLVRPAEKLLPQWARQAECQVKSADASNFMRLARQARCMHWQVQAPSAGKDQLAMAWFHPEGSTARSIARVSEFRFRPIPTDPMTCWDMRIVGCRVTGADDNNDGRHHHHILNIFWRWETITGAF